MCRKIRDLQQESGTLDHRSIVVWYRVRSFKISRTIIKVETYL